MDSNDLEREKGITILAKNTAVSYKGAPDQHHRHARATRTSAARWSAACAWWTACSCWWTPPKARCPRRASCSARRWRMGLKTVLVINKIDRQDARPKEVLDARVLALHRPRARTTRSSSSRSLHRRPPGPGRPPQLEEPGKTLEPLFERSSATSRLRRRASRRRCRCWWPTWTTTTTSAASRSAASAPGSSTPNMPVSHRARRRQDRAGQDRQAVRLPGPQAHGDHGRRPGRDRLHRRHRGASPSATPSPTRRTRWRCPASPWKSPR